EAGVWLRRAYRLAPLSGFILDSLGWLSYQEGHHQRALKLLQMAARMSPSDPEITRHLGDVYALLGKRVEALKAYKAALEFFPDKRLTRLLRERLVELES
ncbi:MAG: tetratricopeptide repeat protein, partial [Myxococcota bacterium]|nr:tetratricopeptide repeat protein [Myxococcota bacterium]